MKKISVLSILFSILVSMVIVMAQADLNADGLGDVSDSQTCGNGFCTHDENSATCYADCGETDGFDVHLRGRVDKGPFIIGSPVSVTLVNGRGNPTSEAFNTHTINNQGQFELAMRMMRYASLEANGYYYNEVTGELSGPIWLRAFYEATSSGVQDVCINVITHLSYGRVKMLLLGGFDFETAVWQAEGELRAALGVGPAGFDPREIGIEMNIMGGDTDANAYLFAVSAVLAQAAQLRGGTTDARLQELINTLSLDFEADGLLDYKVTKELRYAKCTLDLDHVMHLLAYRLRELGSSAEVPDIRRIIDCR